MNRSLRVMLVVLALLVALFAVTWLSNPGGDEATVHSLSPPASWLARGLAHYETRTVIDYTDLDCAGAELPAIPLDCSTRQVPGPKLVAVDELRERELVVFGSAALVILLLGLALGAVRRPTAD